MAKSKVTNHTYKGVEFTLSRNDLDFGDKWTVEGNDWVFGHCALKRHAIELAHFAIDNQ